MSIIFDFINSKCRGFEFDFLRIWNEQNTYTELEKQITVLCTEVYEFITRDDRLTENVTQWCKRKECWARAQKETWTILPEFIRTLKQSADVTREKKEAKETRKVHNEVDSLKYIMGMGSEYWRKVYEWGTKRSLLSDMEMSILQLVINMNKTGRMPSVKQANVVIRARKRMISEGMPMQF